jgi:hypothetical protein
MVGGVAELLLRYTKLRDGLILWDIERQIEFAGQSFPSSTQLRRELLEAHVRAKLRFTSVLGVGSANEKTHYAKHDRHPHAEKKPPSLVGRKLHKLHHRKLPSQGLARARDRLLVLRGMPGARAQQSLSRPLDLFVIGPHYHAAIHHPHVFEAGCLEDQCRFIAPQRDLAEGDDVLLPVELIHTFS